MKNKILNKINNKVADNKILNSKVFKKASDVISKVSNFFLGLMIGTNLISFAAPSGNIEPATLIKPIINVFCEISLYLGILLLVIAFVTYFNARKENNPDGKSKAIGEMITAVCFICIKFFLKTILEAVGVTL